jgi:hypothetical protein
MQGGSADAPCHTVTERKTADKPDISGKPATHQ